MPKRSSNRRQSDVCDRHQSFSLLLYSSLKPAGLRPAGSRPPGGEKPKNPLFWGSTDFQRVAKGSRKGRESYQECKNAENHGSLKETRVLLGLCRRGGSRPPGWRQTRRVHFSGIPRILTDGKQTANRRQTDGTWFAAYIFPYL